MYVTDKGRFRPQQLYPLCQRSLYVPRTLLRRGVLNYLNLCENLGGEVDRTLLGFPGMRQARQLTNPSVKRITNLLSRRHLYLLVGYLSCHHLVH